LNQGNVLPWELQNIQCGHRVPPEGKARPDNLAGPDSLPHKAFSAAMIALRSRT
jgi:hypothetical protein